MRRISRAPQPRTTSHLKTTPTCWLRFNVSLTTNCFQRAFSQVMPIHFLNEYGINVSLLSLADSSQYLNGQQSSQIPAGFQEQLTFLHTDSSHQDQTTSVDATKLALLEQVKHLADALTEGRAGNGNGLDTDLFETGLSQDLDEWTNPLQGRGKDQGHHNQKVIKSSQSHFPEELTNLNDPFVALFLSQLDHPHKTMHSDSKTKPGHVESIQLGDNGEYSSQLSPSVPISPFDPVVLDKDDPFLNLLLHKKVS